MTGVPIPDVSHRRLPKRVCVRPGEPPGWGESEIADFYARTDAAALPCFPSLARRA